MISKNHGVDPISADSFLTYLDGLDVQLDAGAESFRDFSLERFRATNQASLIRWERVHESKLEDRRLLIAAGQSSMKTSILINGGAAVALLAFVGHLVGSGNNALVPGFAVSLVCFVMAVLSGALSLGVTYVTLSSYSAEKTNRGNITNYIAVVLVALSFALFGTGSWFAFMAFCGM